MASNLKHIRGRIRAIRNIKKITKAMELVSISKMRRAVERVLASRPYAQEYWRILRGVTAAIDPDTHALLFAPWHPPIRVLAIVISSDRGLCGSLNSEMIRKVAQFHRLLGNDVSVEFVTVGRKIQDAVRRKAWPHVAHFEHLSVLPAIGDVMAIARLASDGFTARTYDHVFVLYTDFVSTIVQHAVVHQLLPLKQSTELGETRTNVTGESPEATERTLMDNDILFEPSRDRVLSELLPRLVEVQIYQAVLESIASEHAARMVAMKNATDAASNLVDDLTLAFNRLRQASITQEIAEISAGKAVLE